LTPRQEKKSHHKCEKRLKRKKKENPNKETFLFNLKGYFLAFSSLGKAGLGLQVLEGMHRSGGRASHESPPVSSRPILPCSTKTVISVHLLDVGVAPLRPADRPLFKGPFSKRIFPVPAAHRDPFLSRPKPTQMDPQTLQKEDQGGRSCRDERVGGLQAAPFGLPPPGPPSWVPHPSCSRGPAQALPPFLTASTCPLSDPLGPSDGKTQ
jgi:hypothetical protein